MTDQHPSKPTTVRFTADELSLIDAIGAHMGRRGVRHSRSDVIRALLARAQPPDEQSETAHAYRQAYLRVFGETSAS